MNFLPITIESLHETALDCLIVEGQMKIDFGPWKKDQKVILTFDFDQGTVVEHNEDEIVNMVYIKLEVI